MDLHPVSPAQEAQEIHLASAPGSQHRPAHALQCLDCHRYPVYCWECMNLSHRLHPFHRIAIARPGNYCAQTTLTKQGYIFHLHSGNKPCPVPLPGDESSRRINKFVIIDSGSIHTFLLETCSCSKADLVQQLIAAGLFPATFSDPKTAMTFDALDYYLLDNTICHTTAYSFYEKLKHRTNPVLAQSKEIPASSLHLPLGNTKLLQYRYRELLRTSRMWMDIELRLRSGQVFDPMKISGPGSLVLPCYTCPTEHNRQENWTVDPRG